MSESPRSPQLEYEPDRKGPVLPMLVVLNWLCIAVTVAAVLMSVGVVAVTAVVSLLDK